MDEIVNEFSEMINEALDELAPMKKIIIKSNYRFGLSEHVKELMQKRNATRIFSVDLQKKF